MMTSFERLAAALNGEQPDRIPVSVWFHFGSEHLSPEMVADLHEAYCLEYRWDFLKVMFDYRLDLPVGFDGQARPQIEVPLSEMDWNAPFRRQQICLEILQERLGGHTPLFETVYSPWMYLLRHVGYDRRSDLLANPGLAAEVSSRISDAVSKHLQAIRRIGIYGIFFATTVGDVHTGPDEAVQQAKTDMLVLAEAEGLARILHLHGTKTDLARARDYPHEVLHCEDCDPGNPGLAELRKATRGAVMGGLPYRTITRLSPSGIQQAVAKAMDAAGRRGLILAPGCSVSPSVSGRTLRGIRDSAHLANG
ncbi:uroporphyrinogen decarboxylase family protein [Cucumibacter marinus]|uniref:uroporphyrinogen decarboxylase family protein n=1 Tax=Cucumibacter marinus TaxID=1121252 RepID=UPI000424D91E|nr:uroporphyrinogen decarboxylase family protein [Cucumibacter marinus]